MNDGRKRMKTTRYLYNIDPVELTRLAYKDALEYKVSNGIKLLKQLATESRKCHTVYIEQRYQDVEKAIKHTKGLLDELLREDDEQGDETEEHG